MSDLPICDETGDDVDDCHCVDVLDYDERDAADERQQIALDERATFYCERGDHEAPIAGRKDMNDGWSTPDYWCADCYDNYDGGEP